MNTGITEEEAKGALDEKERQAEELLEDAAQTRVTLNKAEKLLGKLKKMPIIGTIVDDIATSIELVKDFTDGRYRRVPARVIVSTLAGILYILSPIDLIPDFIPLAGWLDDVLVFTLILNGGLASELKEYRKWKEGLES
jgi:uncharacterized membrane protein YkvA (DUF1232 family)